jgi:parallel beta-helix repeat protein
MKRFPLLIATLFSTFLFSQVRVTNPRFITTDTWHDIRAYYKGDGYDQALIDAIAGADSGDIVYCNVSFSTDKGININKPLTLLLENSTITFTAYPALQIKSSYVNITGRGSGYSKFISEYDSINIVWINPTGSSGLTNINIDNIFFEGNSVLCTKLTTCNYANAILVSGTESVEYVNVTNCFFDKNRIGVYFGSGVNGGRIESNFININYSGHCGIRVRNSSRLVISNNVIYGDSSGVPTAATGIETIRDNDTVMDHFNISNNVVVGFSFEGINIHGLTYSNIANNTVSCSYTGIVLGSIATNTLQVSYNTINNNTITIVDGGKNGNAGIYVFGHGTSTEGADRNIITQNIIHITDTVASGILSDNKSAHNTYSFNKIYMDSCYVAGRGIYIGSTLGNRIIGNEIYGSSTEGIYLNHSKESYLAFNSVIAGGGYAFRTVGADYTKSFFNLADSCKVGFVFQSSPTGVYEFGNVAYGNVTNFGVNPIWETLLLQGKFVFEDSSKIGTEGEWFRALDFGYGTFTGVEEADTILISGVEDTDFYLLTPYGTAVTANDVLMASAREDSLIVFRPAAGTDGLTYRWWRYK